MNLLTLKATSKTGGKIKCISEMDMISTKMEDLKEKMISGSKKSINISK